MQCFLIFIYGISCLYLERTVDGQEAKWEREREWGQERSVSWDMNSGCPKCNGASCQRAAHKAITAMLLNAFKQIKNCFFTFSGD